MAPLALMSLCAVLNHGRQMSGPSAPTDCGHEVSVQTSLKLEGRSQALYRPQFDAVARDALARLAIAEAGDQGDSGLAAVIYTVLNRLKDGRWGASLDAVLNAKGQFEPVMRAGGDWRQLPRVSATQQTRVDTILNLALEGRLPDLTQGARYFQNAEIIAARARAGQVSPNLVNFGGQSPIATIGGHSFYGGWQTIPKRAGEGRVDPGQSQSVFVGPSPNSPVPAARLDALSPGDGGMFVGASDRSN